MLGEIIHKQLYDKHLCYKQFIQHDLKLVNSRFETDYLHLSGKKKRKQKVTNSEPLMAIMPAPAEA
jgi:hypothetical protein